MILFLDALYKYLKNKANNKGLHIGGSAGFGFGGAGSPAGNFFLSSSSFYSTQLFKKGYLANFEKIHKS